LPTTPLSTSSSTAATSLSSSLVTSCAIQQVWHFAMHFERLRTTIH
jgi:hypothetical protein